MLEIPARLRVKLESELALLNLDDKRRKDEA